MSSRGEPAPASPTASASTARPLHAAGHQVIGLAPSAAHVLGESAGITHTDTVHGLLARLDHTDCQLPQGAAMVLDEAAMCDTRTLLRLVCAADHAGVKLVMVGDDRQIPAVDAGGLFTALTQRLGVFELTVNHRFADLRQRGAAEQLRDRNPDAAISAYQDLGLLRVRPTVTACHEAMLADWLDLIEQGQAARMLADTNRVVADLNIQARHALRERGVVAKGGTPTVTSTPVANSTSPPATGSGSAATTPDSRALMGVASRSTTAWKVASPAPPAAGSKSNSTPSTPPTATPACCSSPPATSPPTSTTTTR
ncbi:MAG: AAA family ATPase [Egibacteraceae bacterium]